MCRRGAFRAWQRLESYNPARILGSIDIFNAKAQRGKDAKEKEDKGV
jgi:hypothetical protein